MTFPHAHMPHELLCCEMAALTTYEKALDVLREEMTVAELTHLRADHLDAVATLRRYMRRGESFPTSAPWRGSDLGCCVIIASSQVRQETLLLLLKQGEEDGSRTYEDALSDDLLPLECRTLVRTKLLPQTQSHVLVLNRLLQNGVRGKVDTQTKLGR